MGTYSGLKQIFYCFGVSFYNYSQVDILGESVAPEYLKGQAKSYFDCLTERIPYRDLEGKNLFKL